MPQSCYRNEHCIGLAVKQHCFTLRRGSSFSAFWHISDRYTMLCVNPAHHYRTSAISAIRQSRACWQSGTKWLHVLILKLCWAYLDLVWMETSVADRLMLMLFLCYSHKWHTYVHTNLSAENLQKGNTYVLAKKTHKVSWLFTGSWNSSCQGWCITWLHRCFVSI